MRFCLFVALVTAFALMPTAQAQYWPPHWPENKPIRLIVPFTAGGGTDVAARVVSRKLAETLGTTIVIDNRGGAGGLLGAQIGARAVADGYTLVFGGASSMINTSFTYKTPGFDAVKDFEPISLVSQQETILSVTPNLPIKSVRDLIALSKAKPNSLNMASAGIGSSSHLAGILFNSMAGIESTHVAYKGGGPMGIAVIAGEAQWCFGLAAAFAGHYKAGRMRAVAVTTRKRAPLMPEVPTVDESGVPGYEYTTWNAFFAPAGVPKAYITRLHATIQKALAEKDVYDAYLAQATVPVGSATPAEFAKYYRADFERVGKLIRMAGIKPE
jgi:tripartite-type tricarboxylate transporter receptor subunit TctC